MQWRRWAKWMALVCPVRNNSNGVVVSLEANGMDERKSSEPGDALPRHLVIARVATNLSETKLRLEGFFCDNQKLRTDLS